MVVSNDSDLAEPIRQVRSRFKKRVIVLFPCSRTGRSPSIQLKMASGIRGGKSPLIVQEPLLAANQFPATLNDATGRHHQTGWMVARAGYKPRHGAGEATVRLGTTTWVQWGWSGILAAV